MSNRPLSPLSPYSGRPSSSSTGSSQRLGPTAATATFSKQFRGDSAPLPRRIGGPAGAAFPTQYDEDEDDELHTFTEKDKETLTSPIDIASWRGWANALMLFVLLAAVVILFGGYPIIEHYKNAHTSFGTNTAGYNLGGVNGSGQYPSVGNMPTLIDQDTPAEAFTHKGDDGKTWNLVFSDEFNVEGRTFFDGDDPFFQAVDLHYWGTK